MQTELPPPPEPATLDEARTLIGVLWARIEEVEGELSELKEKLRVNSSNSSKPPSSDPPNRAVRRSSKGKSGKRRGGQPGHKGSRRGLLPVEKVDQIVACRPRRRCACGGCVHVDPGGPERRQVYELPEVKPVVTEYQVFRGTCTRCRRRVEGDLPVGVPPGMLGPRAMATVAELTGKFHLSKREVVELFREYFGIGMSAATVTQTEARVSAALATPVAAAQEFVTKQPVLHMDETGSKESSRRAWAWVALARSVAVFAIRPSRGGAVARDLMGPDFAGTLVTDRWSGYAFVQPDRRQLCWAHLLRDFTRIQERGGTSEPVGTALLTLTHKTFHRWHDFQAGRRDRDGLSEEMRPIQAALLKALRKGTRGTHPKTQHTCENLLHLRAALFRFVTTPEVEPTNNAAERAIRPYVLWRKKSFGTQGTRGATFVERILTVAATCRNRGLNVLDFLTRTIKAHLHQHPPPSLLPA